MEIVKLGSLIFPNCLLKKLGKLIFFLRQSKFSAVLVSCLCGRLRLTRLRISMSDLCNNDGASRLANQIKEFWRKRGYDVDVETKAEGFVSTMRSARTDLRSDMINGMPRRSAEAG